MKYCLKCGEIVSDNSTSKDRTTCAECNTSYEEDHMTGNMFESLSESEKQKYADELFAKIKNSDIFDESLFNEHIQRYGEASLYTSWWYDRAKQLGARFIHRYETDEEMKQRLDREYGKNSPAYQQAVGKQCKQADREQKQENSNIPHCPICQSTSLHKITMGQKFLAAGFGGIFGMNTWGKTYECNNCGSRF